MSSTNSSNPLLHGNADTSSWCFRRRRRERKGGRERWWKGQVASEEGKRHARTKGHVWNAKILWTVTWRNSVEASICALFLGIKALVSLPPGHLPFQALPPPSLPFPFLSSVHVNSLLFLYTPYDSSPPLLINTLKHN